MSIGGIQRLEKERDVWAQILAGDRLTAAQRREVQRSLNQDIAAINKERQAQTDAIARSDADTDIAIARLSVEAEKLALDEKLAANEVSASEKLTLLRELSAQEFAINNKALEDELAKLKTQPVEYEHVYNQIRELKTKLTLDLAKLDRGYTQDHNRELREEITSWQAAVNEIESVESKLVSDIISGRQRLSKSLQQISLELITKEIQNDIKASTTRMLIADKDEAQKKALAQGGFLYHMLSEGKKTEATVTGEAARTAAEVAGDATRVGSQAAAAVASKAVSKETGKTTIMQDAAKAYSGTYAAIAQIPYVGPFLAPAAATVAYGSVMAMEGLASLDVGAWNVPQDMVAQIHKGETVVPTSFAQGLRQNGGLGGGAGSGSGGSGGGRGGDIHLHVTAMDAPSFVKWTRQNNGSFAAAMQSVHNRFGLSG
jgi:hypothetical protein